MRVVGAFSFFFFFFCITNKEVQKSHKVTNRRQRKPQISRCSLSHRMFYSADNVNFSHCKTVGVNLLHT